MTDAQLANVFLAMALAAVAVVAIAVVFSMMTGVM